MTKITVVAAIINQQRLTLYEENGEVTIISQGDPRVARILEEIKPVVDNIPVTIDISLENEYVNFEKKTNGLVRLFRVAKQAVASIFGSNEPQILGTIPVPPTEKEAKLDTALADIMANAQPVASKGFREHTMTDDDTIIAVVGDKVIPHMEKLKDQFAHSNKMGSTIGMENFLKRVALVISDRGHSVEDLLRFMEKGDLPIANDGSIIIYKILNRKDTKSDTFYDVHTGKVPQKIGSVVCMDKSLVDPNRRNECSNGLHVARRGYLGSFSGNVMVLAKVAPEDVIAVPAYDGNKVRVCAYHILSIIDPEDARKLKNNTPMTDTAPARIALGQAITGNHVGKLEEVRITQQNGGGIIITPLGKTGKPDMNKAPVFEAVALDDLNHIVEGTDPAQISKEVLAAKGGPVEPAPKLEPVKPAAIEETRNQRAFRLYAVLTGSGPVMDKQKAAMDLRDLKRKSKLSWLNLGLPGTTGIIIEDLLNPTSPVPEPVIAKNEPATKAVKPISVKAQPEPIKAEVVKAKVHSESPAKAKASKPIDLDTMIDTGEVKSFNRNELAQNLYINNAYDDLYALKRKSKVSWERLGFEAKDIVIIEANAPKK